MNAALHSAVTGAPAKITKKEGTSFSAHGSYVKGKNLKLVPKKLIVQSWRGSDWRDSETDSIFILSFKKITEGTEIKLVHANIPDRLVASIDKGWKEFYWKKWGEYLRSNPQ